MAKSIAQLLIDIGANTAAFRSEMEAVKRINKETADTVKTAWSSISDLAAMAGIGLSVRELIEQFSQVTESAHQLELQSQKLGTNVEDYQRLSLAFKAGGVDAGEFQGMVRKLSQEISAAESGNRTAIQHFKDLGIQWQDLATGKGRPVLDVLLALADRFSIASDGANKNAWAVAMLGRAGMDAIPTLNQGAESIKQYGVEADKLGAIIGKDMVDKLAKVKEQNELLNASWQATKARLVDDVIPAVQQFQREMSVALNTYGNWHQAIGQMMGNAFRGVMETLTGQEHKGPAEMVQDVQSRLDALAAQIQREGSVRTRGLTEGQAYGYQQRVADLLKELQYWQAMVESDKAIIESRTVKATGGTGLGSWDPTKPKTSGAWGDEDLKGVSTGMQQRKSDLDRLIETLQRQYTTISQGADAWNREALAIAASSDKDKEKYATAAKLIDQIEEWNDLAQYRLDLQEAEEIEEEQLERTRAAMIRVQDFQLKNAQDEIRLRAQVVVGFKEQRDIERQLLELNMQQELARITASLADDAEAVEAATAAWKKFHDAQMSEFDRQTATAKTWAQGWEDAFKRYRDAANDNAQHAGKIFDDVTKGMEDSLVNFVHTGKLDFSSLANSIIDDLLRIQIEKQMTGIFEKLGGSDWFAGISDFLGFASGGDITAGTVSVVGERGPELFIPKTSGTIIPAPITQSMLSQSQTLHVTNAPVIQIDSRSDAAQIRGLVDDAMAQSESRIYESMRRRGAFSVRN